MSSNDRLFDEISKELRSLQTSQDAVHLAVVEEFKRQLTEDILPQIKVMSEQLESGYRQKQLHFCELLNGIHELQEQCRRLHTDHSEQNLDQMSISGHGPVISEPGRLRLNSIHPRDTELVPWSCGA